MVQEKLRWLGAGITPAGASHVMTEKSGSLTFGSSPVPLHSRCLPEKTDKL